MTLCLCGYFSLCLGGHPSTQPLGRISFPTSGAAAAQPHFIRGVLLLHSFEYDPAIEAFREAQRIDPGFALAYWGEAMCDNQPLWYHENFEKGRAVLARLGQTSVARAAKAPTPREQGYLDAVEKLFGRGDKPARDRGYLARMRELTRDFPDDDEAAAFYALALLASIPQGDRNAAISLQAGAIATAILDHNPQHPGAAHYALHAYDDGEHAARGLEAARIYAKIAPASSHAQHMPAHIFLPLGMWDDAAAADESAFAASLADVKQRGVSLAQADFHSLSWLQYEYLQQGRFRKARELFDPVNRALADGSSGTHESQHMESDIGRGFGPVSLRNALASMRARLVVESGAWNEMKGSGSFENVDELFALGLSSVKLRDLPRADAAVEHMANAVKAIPDRDAREVAAIMWGELDGMLRIARGDPAAGLAALGRAATLEAARPRPIARPYPIKPAGELYAEALSANGQSAAAIQQFQSALARTPNRAAALIGLAQTYRAAGRAAEAADAARHFIRMWHAADEGRPEILLAKSLAGRGGK